MPTIAISFAESALRDIEEIKNWDIKQEVPDVGEKFVAKLFQRVEDLADHPDIGRIVPKFGQPFLREIIHPPFPSEANVCFAWPRRTINTRWFADYFADVVSQLPAFII